MSIYSFTFSINHHKDFLLTETVGILTNMDNTSIKPIAPYRIGLLMVDGFAIMSYASATEPLRAANLLAETPLYSVKHIPVSGARAISSNKTEIKANAQMGEQADYDLVLVIAGNDPAIFNDRRALQWLRHLSHRGIPLGGVSGGSMILAAAGVMKGRRMTIHWEHAEVLKETYPSLLVEKTLFVMDRDRITCAGGTAPLDMMNALITRHHGADFARKVSDWFMHTDVRASDDPQRSGLAERYQIHNATVLTAVDIMRNHLADPLDLTQLSQLAGVSTRQLNRLFYDHLKTSPMAFCRELRLEKAYTLLEKSALSIMDIALATGFTDPAHFSRTFSSQFGKSPSMARKAAGKQAVKSVSTLL